MGDVCHFSLRGEIDLTTAPHLRRSLLALVQDSDADLRVDCEQLQFIDSLGIAVLLEVNRELEASQRHMHIANVPHGPRRVFELLGLTDLVRNERGDQARSEAQAERGTRHLRLASAHGDADPVRRVEPSAMTPGCAATASDADPNGG